MAIQRYIDIENRINALLHKRGLYGNVHVAVRRFCDDFRAYLISYDAIGKGNAEITLSLLENDSNLTDGNILNTNFRSTLKKLVSPVLFADPLFIELFPILLNSKGKGVGIGEMVLPLILSSYRFSNIGDGILFGSIKIEVKQNGASIKPIKTGITQKGLVDTLNNQYFNGAAPGYTSTKLFNRHLATVTDPGAQYGEYFSRLYPGCDIAKLIEDVKISYRSPKDFNSAVGNFALKQYQQTDGWHAIMFIDCKTQELVNIVDVEHVSDLGIRYTPRLTRCKDTQAVCDGYVNATFK
jgi:hypothetical protein